MGREKVDQGRIPPTPTLEKTKTKKNVGHSSRQFYEERLNNFFVYTFCAFIFNPNKMYLDFVIKLQL